MKAVNRCVSSDAEGERANRGCRKKRAPCQQAYAVARIAEEVAQPWKGLLIADGFRGLGEPAMSQVRVAMRVSLAQGVLFGHIDLVAEILFDFRITALEGTPELPQPLFHHASTPTRLPRRLAAAEKAPSAFPRRLPPRFAPRDPLRECAGLLHQFCGFYRLLRSSFSRLLPMLRPSNAASTTPPPSRARRGHLIPSNSTRIGPAHGLPGQCAEHSAVVKVQRPSSGHAVTRNGCRLACSSDACSRSRASLAARATSLTLIASRQIGQCSRCHATFSSSTRERARVK